MPLLFRAATVDWTLEISGKRPDLPSFIRLVPESRVVADGSAVALSIRSESASNHVAADGDDETAMRSISSDEAIKPLLFEAVGYDIHFEQAEGGPFSVTLPAGAELRRNKKGLQHYAINFGNNVGFFDIRISSPTETTTLRFEVFSRKIDYRADYVAMREEISGILRNLAMTANAKTYSFAAPSQTHKPTLVEWFALLKKHFEEFIKLTNAVANKPHTGLDVRAIKQDTERARRVSRQTFDRALRRGNAGPAIPGLGVSMPRRIDEKITSPTFDTAENRYYKALLMATYRNMRALSKIDASGDEDAELDSERKFFACIRPELKVMERRLETALKAPFLGAVSEGLLARPASMVFHKHPIYSRVDKMARLLNGGLSFAGGVIPIGVKDTALLYEYWCFLKIIDILRHRFDLVEQRIVKTHRFKTTVTLAKGKAAAMQFIHPPTQKKLRVFYNRMFRRLPTIAQKPDNVIQFATDDKFYIFDAKYRLQFDKIYTSQYGGVGPRVEDINTMHRYRDAIAIPHPLRPLEYIKGVVMGAVVLFPFPDEDGYREHQFYRSIDQVEIGGLPFLPHSTTLMSEKIAALLAADFPNPE